MAKLKIIGTSHIAPESIKKVEKTILETKPDIVAIELDKKRLVALLTKSKEKARFRDIKRVGLKGWLFALIGAWAERKLGAKVGVFPGSEMLKAIAAAQQVKAKIALIDQDIEITLRKFSKALSWKEKFTFLGDIFKGVFLKKGVQFDLAKVPSQKVIEKLREEDSAKGKLIKKYEDRFKQRTGLDYTDLHIKILNLSMKIFGNRYILLLFSFITILFK